MRVKPIRLDDETIARVEAEASARGVSFSVVVRERLAAVPTRTAAKVPAPAAVGPRRRARTEPCEHRIRPDAFCKVCD